ncbi:MAG: chorismate synthase [Clostridia bacterium]|nr:chorismate synthase [Clostridia bacterium]
MAFSYGNRLKLSIFGQSHSAAIGVTCEGLPAGVRIDFDALSAFMARRAPGRNLTTPRSEKDAPVFLSGVTDGVTNGAPLTAVIYNENTRSKDYSELKIKPRPGHSDYPAAVKFDGHNDIAGGGQFSARLTAPLCIIGGIVIEILKRQGIEICAHIVNIGGAGDPPFDPVNEERALFADIKQNNIAVYDDAAAEKISAAVEQVRAAGDSIGGIVECKIVGLPVGLGNGGFGGLDGKIASAIFGVPAVKGIDFGAGFSAGYLRGSENNDEYYFDENGNVKTYTNRAGGIVGGMSNGMPVIFRTAFKPTPSIAKAQRTVNLATGQNDTLVIHGRHDPCVVLRAVPVVEAAAAIAVYDALPEH